MAFSRPIGANRLKSKCYLRVLVNTTTRGFSGIIDRPSNDTAKPIVIDMHSHFLPQEIPDYHKKFGGEDWPWMRPLKATERDHDPNSGISTYGYGHKADAMLMQGDQNFRPVTKAAWDIETRINDLDKAGIDHQVCCHIRIPNIETWYRK